MRKIDYLMEGFNKLHHIAEHGYANADDVPDEVIDAQFDQMHMDGYKTGVKFNIIEGMK